MNRDIARVTARPLLRGSHFRLWRGAHTGQHNFQRPSIVTPFALAPGFAADKLAHAIPMALRPVAVDQRALANLTGAEPRFRVSAAPVSRDQSLCVDPRLAFAPASSLKKRENHRSIPHGMALPGRRLVRCLRGRKILRKAASGSQVLAARQ